MPRKAKYPFRPPLTRSQYEGIGHITALWAYIETEIDQSILLILKGINPEYRPITPSEMDLARPFKQRARQLKDLYAEIFADKSDIEKAHDIIDRSIMLHDDRNHVIHGHWHFTIVEDADFPPPPEKIQLTLERYTKKPTIKTMDFETQTLRDIAGRLSVLARDLIVFNLNALKGVQPASPGEYFLLSGPTGSTHQSLQPTGGIRLDRPRPARK